MVDELDFTDLSSMTDDERDNVYRKIASGKPDYPLARDPAGRSALHYACVDLRPQQVDALIEAGADLNAKEGMGWTPLHFLADVQTSSEEKSKIADEIMLRLIDAGADIEAENNRGYSPLFLATVKSRISRIKILLAAGADPFHKNNNKIRESPVDYARFDPETRPLFEQYLIGDTTPPQPTNDWRQRENVNELHKASGPFPDLEKVKQLIAEGEDVNVKDEDHYTPLHYASQFGNTEIVKYLLDHGANVNALSTWHLTPLYVSCSFTTSNSDIVNILLDYGADPYIKTIKGINTIEKMVNTNSERREALYARYPQENPDNKKG